MDPMGYLLFNNLSWRSFSTKTAYEGSYLHNSFRFRSDGAFWMAWVDFQVGFFGGKFESLSESASKQTHTEAALENYPLLCCVGVFCLQ